MKHGSSLSRRASRDCMGAAEEKSGGLPGRMARIQAANPISPDGLPGTNPFGGRLIYAKQTVLESFRRSSHSVKAPGEGQEFNQNSTPYGRYYTRSTAAPAI
jgi:hypothetical protein